MKAKLQTYRNDPAAFVLDVMAELGLPVAPCQAKLIRQMSPSLLAIADGRKPEVSKLWLSATKGWGKSLLVSLFLVWLLAFSPKALTLHVAARDRDQAGDIRDWMRDILRAVPRLAQALTITKDTVDCKATGSSCVCLTSESGAGAHGPRPTVVVLEEYTHQSDEEVANAHLDNLAKAPFGGLLMVPTNAGFTGTFQYRLREIARTNPDRWLFVEWCETPPWQDPADIAEARARRTLSSFNRLYRGIWSSGTGDALDPQLIDDAIVLSGPMADPLPGWVFIGGLDLAVSKDHAAFVCQGVELGHNRISLITCKSWAPSRGRQIDLNAVERYVLDFHARFRLRTLWYDPFQCAQMAQTFVRSGLRAEPMNFVGRNLDAMATAVLESFSTPGFVQLFPHSELVRDLQRLNIVEKPYGFKLESVRDADGHADLGTSWSISAVEAIRIAGQQSQTRTPPRAMNIQPAQSVAMNYGAPLPRGVRTLSTRSTYRRWGTC